MKDDLYNEQETIEGLRDGALQGYTIGYKAGQIAIYTTTEYVSVNNSFPIYAYDAGVKTGYLAAYSAGYAAGQKIYYDRNL